MNTPNKIFTVVQQSQNHFNIIDAQTGTFVNRIVTQGDILSGPIVVGDRCTFVIQMDKGQTIGMIYSLPQGTLLNRYMV